MKNLSINIAKLTNVPVLLRSLLQKKMNSRDGDQTPTASISGRFDSNTLSLHQIYNKDENRPTELNICEKQYNKWNKAINKLHYAYVVRFCQSDFWWALFTDILAFFFFFLMFFNNYQLHNFKPGDANYKTFDQSMRSFLFPIYIAIFLPVCMFNPYAYSVFTLLIQEVYVLILLGECSLPIYLYHVIIAQYMLVPHDLFPTDNPDVSRSNLRDGFAKNNHFSRDPSIYATLAVTFVFSILMQKVFQDRFVTNVYLAVNNKIKSLSTSKSTNN